MRLKFIMAIAALFVASACTTVTDTDSGAGGSGESTKSSSSSSVESSQSKSAEILPGSQADLVSNVGDRVLFEYDSSDLTPEARRTLERQAAWLKRYSNVSITVEGHCDERGTREYNLALGERRATAVSNFLVALGINGARIMTISYGKEKPVALGSNDTAWSQNRRGVTRVRAQ
ncbi:MAG: peptidoglycan-associated lipoprotein [Rhodospirillaceae bacterium]|nr:peptidoglycan-associated lipoprotein [Rhodospirillaceae bacterium]